MRFCKFCKNGAQLATGGAAAPADPPVAPALPLAVSGSFMEGISHLQPTIHNIAYSSCDAYPTITGLVCLGRDVLVAVVSVCQRAPPLFGRCDRTLLRIEHR